MAKRFNREAAEWEANEIAFQFRDSHDVVGDMSRAYHTDFSGIRLHEDASAQARVGSAGTDALAKGSDIYFKKGILSGNDQASRGLLAHELAHTMQQGIVAGDVAESAPAGAEQGGFLDKIKGWFGGKKKPKYQYLGGQKATDDDSLKYMAAMRAREAELTEQKRAAALNGVGPVGQNTMSPETMARLSAFMPAKVKDADKMWEDYANKPDVSDALRVSYAYQALKLRETKSQEGALYKDLEEQAFAGSSDAYDAYFKALDASGVNFHTMMEKSGLNEYFIDGRKYEINDAIGGITSDIYSIASKYLLSDTGLDLIESIYNNIQDAKVFGDTGISPLNYIMTTIMTSEGAHSLTKMNNGLGYAQTGQDAIARQKVAISANKQLLNPMTMERMTEEDRAGLPPQIQALYAQYKDIQNRIMEALEARKIPGGVRA